MEERPTRRKSIIKTNWFFIVLFAILTIYMFGYIRNNVLATTTDQVRIVAYYMYTPPTFAGVIVRDEIVQHSIQSGEILFDLENHTRVRQAHRVATAGGFIPIFAEYAGVVSFHTDGFESALTPANVTSVPASINENAPYTQCDRIFRIVRSNDWFVVAHVDPAYVWGRGWQIGQTLTIFVHQPEGIVPLVTTIDSLISHNSIYYHLVLRTNFETLRFIDQRNIVFSLQQTPAQGLRVPSTAIVSRSIFSVPRDFVQLRYETTTVQREGADGSLPVSGWVSNDGERFYILAEGSNLRLGDILIHEEGRFVIEIIDTVQGVFMTNRGHALFRQISLPQNIILDEVEYVVLDPSQNPHIRLFDWIVSDARDAGNRLLVN